MHESCIFSIEHESAFAVFRRYFVLSSKGQLWRHSTAPKTESASPMFGWDWCERACLQIFTHQVGKGAFDAQCVLGTSVSRLSHGGNSNILSFGSDGALCRGGMARTWA